MKLIISIAATPQINKASRLSAKTIWRRSYGIIEIRIILSSNFIVLKIIIFKNISNVLQKSI